MTRRLLITLSSVLALALTLGAGARAAVPASLTHDGAQRPTRAQPTAPRNARRRRSHTLRAVPRHARAVHARRLTAHTAAVHHDTGDLRSHALGAYSAQVAWPAVPGAAAVEVSVNGTLVDRFASSASDSYTVTELWPHTSAAISVTILSVTGAQLAGYSASVTTPAQTTAFPRLYAPTAFINTRVSPAPSLDPNSAGIVASSLGAYVNSASLSNNSGWGIPIVTADSQSSGYNVGCEYWWCNMNFGNTLIPTNAQPNTGSDGHLTVLQPDGSEMDMWIGQHTSSGWTSGSRWQESASGPAANCTLAHQCGGADAANFALAAGVIRPEEIAQGHIDHALALTTPDTRKNYAACPATSTDGQQTSPNSLPMGAHIQLDPSINVATLNIPSWQKVIAVALQQYGAYVVDTGGSLEVRGESNLGRTYDAWAKAGVPANAPSLTDLPWGSMRVLSMTQCA